jgi:hypothetical protein
MTRRIGVAIAVIIALLPRASSAQITMKEHVRRVPDGLAVSLQSFTNVVAPMGRVIVAMDLADVRSVMPRSNEQLVEHTLPRLFGRRDVT